MGLEPAASRFQVKHPNHFAMLPPQTFNKQAKANTSEIALLTYAAAQLLISCSIFVWKFSPKNEEKGKLKFMICLDNFFYCFLLFHLL